MKFLYSCWGAWTALGFYRGVETYSFSHHLKTEEYKKHLQTKLNCLEKIRKRAEELTKIHLVSGEAMCHTTEDVRTLLEKTPQESHFQVRNILSDMTHEERWGSLKEKKEPLFLCYKALGSGLFTGGVYACLPISLFVATGFEAMRLEMWLRGLNKEDLKNSKDYYFKL